MHVTINKPSDATTVSAAHVSQHSIYPHYIQVSHTDNTRETNQQ